MTIAEYIISWLPLLFVLVLMMVLVRKTGAFQQREHRKKVEQLLERIANAVEKIPVLKLLPTKVLLNRTSTSYASGRPVS